MLRVKPEEVVAAYRQMPEMSPTRMEWYDEVGQRCCGLTALLLVKEGKSTTSRVAGRSVGLEIPMETVAAQVSKYLGLDRNYAFLFACGWDGQAKEWPTGEALADGEAAWEAVKAAGLMK